MGVKSEDTMFPWNQFLDLVDTIVKIGLGAAISGILTYKLTKLNYDDEIRKTRWLRQQEVLESCGEKAETYIWRMNRFFMTVDGTRILNEQKKISKFTSGQWEGLSKLDVPYVESGKELHYVVARLRLVGAIEAAKQLALLNNTAGDFRDDLMLRNTEPTAEKMEKQIAELKKQVVIFHEAMSQAYAQLNPTSVKDQ
jgi:hypothetical protein